MSKIEVDQVDPQSGTTLTLGTSGDTVNIPSGVTITNNGTQTGFGRTGTVDWQTGSIKTATFTAVSGQGFFCDTSSGGFEVDLPAGSAGAIVSIQDYKNTFDSNALTVDPNGSEKINGGAAGETLTLDTEGQGLTLVYIDSTIGWRSVQDNTFATVGGSFLTATGGTESTCGNYKIHTFTGPGTFSVSSVSSCSAKNVVDYLVVAGGGAAPATNGGDGISGGGGAGGFRYFANPSTNPQSGNPGSPLNAPAGITVTATSFPIAVGGGGPAGSAPTGWAPGVNSTFSTITAAGGGRGGRGDPTDPSAPLRGGQPGGSGGGGDNGPSAGGTGNTPSVSPAQGTNGGEGGGSSAAGGGGAIAAGAAGSTNGGNGGAGAGITGFGSSNGECSSCVQYFSGGGGGGNGNANFPSPGTTGSGGLGGGADGKNPSCVSASNGTANTGGGGGGASDKNPGGGAGGAGGSGIVVIRYQYQ
jgi:hypothetical protein